MSTSLGKVNSIHANWFWEVTNWSMGVSKHTPGPWGLEKAEPERSGNYYVLAPDMNLAIARVYRNSGEANACLIRAAPDLLKALQIVIKDKAPSCHDCIDDGLAECAWCIARAAITKALGKK